MEEPRTDVVRTIVIPFQGRVAKKGIEPFEYRGTFVVSLGHDGKVCSETFYTTNSLNDKFLTPEQFDEIIDLFDELSFDLNDNFSFNSPYLH